MKKSIFILGALAFVSLTSCKKTETVNTDSDMDTTASVVIVDSDSMPIMDSTVNEADNAAGRAVDATGNAIKDGANAVKDAAKDATDGDGDITK